MIVANSFFSILFWSTVSIIFLACLGLFFFKTKKKSFSQLSVHYQIKNLLIISLLAAISVSVLFLFSKFSSVVVLPNFRTAFSGILVKISGFAFGPIIGIVSALITEFLLYLFIPTYFHYKFLLLLMSFGAFAGMVRYLLIFKIKKISLQIFLIYLFLTAFFLLTQFFFYINGNSTLSSINLFKVLKTKYLLVFHFESFIFYSNLIAFSFLYLILNLIVFIIFNKKNYFKKIITKQTARKVLPIFFFAILSEYFISLPLGSYANQSVFGETSRSGFILFSSAIFFAPIKIIVNTFIIYNTWNALKKHFNRKTFFL